MNDSVTLTVRDERTIHLPVAGTSDDLRTAAQLFEYAAEDGYRLMVVDIVQGGHQRDPTTTGVNLTLRR